MKAIEVFISGVVQGVGFRYFTVKVARELGIKGYVKNLADGRVYIYAIGEEEALEKFLANVRKGPPLAVVRDVIVKSAPIQECEKFEVRR
ncbi:MAG: acylphosphatase [Archaeoglobaceae archaeon]